MAQQSLLAKLGARVGTLGLSTSLAIAAPLAEGNYNPTCHTDAARIGWYFDRTLGVEAIGKVIGGITACTYTANFTTFLNVYSVLSTPSPIMTMGNGTGTPTLVINGISNNRQLRFLTASVDRIYLLVNNTAETGSDAGSNWNFRAFDDTGTLIGTNIWTLTRAAGTNQTIGRPVAIVGGTFAGTQKVLNCSGTWNNAASVFTGSFIGATNTASAAGSLIAKARIGASVKWSIGINGVVTSNSTDDLTGAQWTLNRFSTLTGNVTDNISNIASSTSISGAFTVTRYNWINLNDITGAATITDATVFYFNAAAGTHKCVDTGSTKTSPQTVTAWMKVNINGTIYYAPSYASKTS